MNYKQCPKISAALWKAGIHTKGIDAVIHACCALLTEGYSLRHVANICQIHKNTLAHHLRDEDLPASYPGEWHRFPFIREAMHAQYVFVRTPDDMDMWCALEHRGGYSCNRLADVIGITSGTVRQHVKRGKTLLITHAPPALPPLPYHITVPIPKLDPGTLVKVAHPRYCLMGTFLRWSVTKHHTRINVEVNGHPVAVNQKRIELYSTTPAQAVEPVTDDDFIKFT